MLIKRSYVFCFITALISVARADVSELLINDTDHHHHHHHEKENNLKDLQEIKFSLNIILRELKYLMSHPVFHNIKEDLDKSLLLDMKDTNESVLTDVMHKMEEKLHEMDNIKMPDYTSETIRKQDEEEIKYEAPDIDLLPPTNTKVTSFGTVIDNFWLNDNFQAQDASSKILVAISPVLRAPRLDKEFFRRNKRELDLPFIDPLALNDELMSKLVFRRAISSDTPYNYDRPVIKFDEGASVKDEKEYLPPLETSQDIINTVKQPYTKENGYEYKRPQRPFNLPSETATVRTVVTTKAPIKIQEKDYLPPFQGSSANNVPKVVVTTTTTKKPEYLPPPLEPSAAIINTVKQPFSKETGYEYKRPSKPFNLPNENSLTILDVRSSNNVPKIVQTTKSTDYLPPLEPSPANNIPATIMKEDGYSYPRPSKPFPPLEPSPSNTVAPQTIKPTTVATTTQAPTTTEKEYLPPKYEASNSDDVKVETFEPPKQKYDPINGYDYSKPSIKFETGLDVSNTNDAPTNTDYPKQKYDPVNGYDYAKPSIKFETGVDYLPPKQQQQQRTSKGIQVIALGGAAATRDNVYDKLNPVNRLSEDILALRSRR